MNKKIIIIFIVLIVLIGVLVFKDRIFSNESSNEKEFSGDVLVVYFSATNNTKKVAEEIADNLKATIFEVVPKEEYTADDLDYSDEDSRVFKEHSDESLRDVELVSTTVDNWENYDTVFIGYPIWWGEAAWPINNFVKENDFKGKTVIPFCTSASSSLGSSSKKLEDLAGSGDWKSGKRFSSGASSSEIKEWLESLTD